MDIQPLLSESARPIHPVPTTSSSLKAIITCSPLNFLLVVIPFAFLASYFKASDTIVFILNFLAIVPLAKLLAFSTEEISLRTSQTIGALLLS
jgi:Ca2+:H+ antiporter